jgi:hypothetical protein
MIESLNKVMAKLEQLSESQQEKFVQEMLEKLESLTSLPKGVKGEILNRYAGIISQDDLQLMSQAILEGCEVINENEW